MAIINRISTYKAKQIEDYTSRKPKPIDGLKAAFPNSAGKLKGLVNGASIERTVPIDKRSPFMGKMKNDPRLSNVRNRMQ